MTNAANDERQRVCSSGMIRDDNETAQNRALDANGYAITIAANVGGTFIFFCGCGGFA